jgi:hypothetical protein
MEIEELDRFGVNQKGLEQLSAPVLFCIRISADL